MENDDMNIIERNRIPPKAVMLSNARKLRREMTPEERKLWYEFPRKYPVKFRKQHILGGFILDFYCPDALLVVELDGNQHFEADRQEHDSKRTEFLNRRNILVVRYRNVDIRKNFRWICEQIDYLVQQRRRRG